MNIYLSSNISSYLYKTSKTYKSDIANFGKYALPKYLTWEEWEQSDWLSNYSNSFFTVNVHTNVLSSYLFTKM